MNRFTHVILILASLWLVACSSAPSQDVTPTEPVYSAERVLTDDVVDPTEVWDPWEPMNRRIYSFNYHFDKWVFVPTVNGYKKVVPGFARKGVHNFFNNWRDLRTFVNSILQLDSTKTFQSAGRVLVNSTVGLLGFVDVATSLDVPRPQEDFGQTLGHWGVGKGPYLVIPFLGPSNLRDGFGQIPDFLVTNEIRKEVLAKPVREWIWLPEAIDTRANVSFRYYETGSPFEYETVRWLMSAKRDLDVEK